MSSPERPDWPQAPTEQDACLPDWAYALPRHLDKHPELLSTLLTVTYRDIRPGLGTAELRVQVCPIGTEPRAAVLLAWMSTLADPLISVAAIRDGKVHLHLTGALTGGVPVTVVVVVPTGGEAGLLGTHMAIEPGAVVPVDVLQAMATPVEQLPVEQLPVDGQPETGHQGDLGAGQAVDR